MPASMSLVANPSITKSIQRGTISLTAGNASGAVTISSVNTAKAELSKMGEYCTNDQTVGNDCNFNYLTLASATSVGINRSGTVGTSAASFQVVERY